MKKKICACAAICTSMLLFQSNASAQKPEAKLELVYSDSAYQLTGVAAHGAAPVMINYPRWSEKYRYGVVQATGDSSSVPYPNDTMNMWSPGEDGKRKWVCVQSVYYDNTGTLWVLDPAAPMLKKIQGNGAKLVKFAKNGKDIERTYSFMDILPDTAYVNDVRVDTKLQFAYLTESKGGGIIVVNLKNGRMRRVLSKHYSTKSDPEFKYIIDGHELMKDGKPAKFNSDGIALSPDGGLLYYKSITDDKLYRIRTIFLRDWSMNDNELGNKVEDLGHFASTDGMIFDDKGNLYMGDPRDYNIIKIDKNLKMKILVQDRQKLIWPDSYAVANGYLYVSCSQIHKQPAYNDGADKRTSPYSVYRIKL